MAGFESPFGLELLTTIHWLAVHEGVSSAEFAVGAVHGWSRRKRRFSADQIRSAWRILETKGWLTPKAS